MMVKFKWLFILSSIFSVSCVTIKSKSTNLLLDSKYEKYNAFHDVALVNTDITKELMVNGVLTATNSKLHKVSLNGSAVITNTVIYEDISINGELTVDKTVLKKNVVGHGKLLAKHAKIRKIDLAAKIIILNDTVVDSIRIREFKNTTIYVRNNSVVTGSIVFDTGLGRVVIDKSSHVKGSITGACIKKEALEVIVGKNY